jgi:hypothetical protein
MTTAFQTVFDNATTLGINKRKKVSQTVARDGTVKATSLGGQVWEFEVRLPDGDTWTKYRPLVEKMEALDRVSTGTVQISKAGQSYISGYQGNLTNTTGVTVSYSSGTTLTITGGATTSSGFILKSGDFIQLGTGGVYTVVNDVAFNQTSITTNRPVRDTAGTYTLKIGQAVTWSVLCVNFPKWTLTSHNRVSWDGAFIFVEAL